MTKRAAGIGVLFAIAFKSIKKHKQPLVNGWRPNRPYLLSLDP